MIVWNLKSPKPHQLQPALLHGSENPRRPLAAPVPTRSVVVVKKPHFSQKRREMGHPRFLIITQMWATPGAHALLGMTVLGRSRRKRFKEYGGASRWRLVGSASGQGIFRLCEWIRKRIPSLRSR